MRTRTRDDNLGPIKDGDVVRTRMMAMDHKTVDSVDAMLNRELGGKPMADAAMHNAIARPLVRTA
jgi:hypothetical protein